jgi:hypothetical protein
MASGRKIPAAGRSRALFSVVTANWLQVFGVGESVLQYEGKAGRMRCV